MSPRIEPSDIEYQRRSTQSCSGDPKNRPTTIGTGTKLAPYAAWEPIQAISGALHASSTSIQPPMTVRHGSDLRLASDVCRAALDN
jgi:hypothetical protein